MRIGRSFPYQYVGVFKGLLFLSAVVLTVSVLAYSQFLVGELQDATRRNLTQKIRTYSALIRSDNPALIGIALEQIQEVEFPIVVTDGDGIPKLWKNIDIASDDSSKEALKAVRELVRVMDDQGNEPLAIIAGEDQTDWFHYGESVIIRQLRWLPWIEIGAVILFVIVGYYGFQSIRRSEERMVWVGLAKETAHQLGTPITSLMGWTEILRSKGVNDRSLNEMERDLARLERVTARFSQIGSGTQLAKRDVAALIEETADYFRSRLPQTGKSIEIVSRVPASTMANVNSELFGWVLENLLKNSIDALRTTGGRIEFTCEARSGWIHVDVSDNGSGISPRNRRNVFRPGFTTKTRGWGLGLSLSKRIMEDYHGGRLFVKESVVGKGTTMRISLRSNNNG